MTKMTRPGDVFVRQHPDGRYGAVRVLRVDGKSIMLCTTTYLAKTPPLESDEELRRPIEQRRFFYQGEAAIKWLEGKPPACFVFAFNLPLDEAETRIECNTYGRAWAADAGFEAFMEWRWLNDRPALEAEVQADQLRRDEEQRQAALTQRPKRMMAEDDFWALIDLLDWTRTGDDEAVLAPLVAKLSSLTKPALRHFAERLAYCLYCLDTREHARNIGSEAYVDEETYFSSDWFLYVRCAAVANGRTFYEAALATPEEMPKDLEFEALLGAASSAWEARTGSDFDHDPGCSHESFSNLAGWSKNAPAHAAGTKT